jgi:hypothetical protein
MIQSCYLLNLSVSYSKLYCQCHPQKSILCPLNQLVIIEDSMEEKIEYWSFFVSFPILPYFLPQFLLVHNKCTMWGGATLWYYLMFICYTLIISSQSATLLIPPLKLSTNPLYFFLAFFTTGLCLDHFVHACNTFWSYWPTFMYFVLSDSLF